MEGYECVVVAMTFNDVGGEDEDVSVVGCMFPFGDVWYFGKEGGMR